MSRVSNWRFQTKIVVLGIALPIMLSVVLFVLYAHDARASALNADLAKAQAIVLTVESMRDEMQDKWEQGVFTQAQLREWADAGEVDKTLAAVPVVSSWRSAMRKAAEGDYSFRVPKFSARNPKNEPDEFEARVLRLMKDQDLIEYHEIDEVRNEVRYFRPIILTETCMLCHGDPSTSLALWGNTEGLDPTGGRMEDWKVGEMHGAFEVIQSLDQADQAIASAITRGGAVVACGVLVLGLVFILVARVLSRRLTGEVGNLRASSTQLKAASQQQLSSTAEQTAATGQSLATMKELTASAGQIAERCQKVTHLADIAATRCQEGDAAVREGQNVTGEIKTQIETIVQHMVDLGNKSQQINLAVDVISELAEQTTILSYNAAIEAAAAGEAGQTFSVVAEQVGKLAERTKQATKEVRGIIDEIQTSTSTTIMATEDGLKAADRGMAAQDKASEKMVHVAQEIRTTLDAAREIEMSSKQQTTAAEQVREGLDQVVSAAKESEASAKQTLGTADLLVTTAAHLGNI